MLFSVLAALTAVVHGAFIAFVLAGGLLLPRWPLLVWLHGPVALYGITIMVFNWQCPLTDLEIALRQKAGESVQWDVYINHYILGPMGFDGSEWFVMPAALGLILLANGWPYWRLFGKKQGDRAG